MLPRTSPGMATPRVMPLRSLPLSAASSVGVASTKIARAVRRASERSPSAGRSWSTVRATELSPSISDWMIASQALSRYCTISLRTG